MAGQESCFALAHLRTVSAMQTISDGDAGANGEPGETAHGILRGFDRTPLFSLKTLSNSCALGE
jgi:hypothetical protein